MTGGRDLGASVVFDVGNRRLGVGIGITEVGGTSTGSVGVSGNRHRTNLGTS